MTRILSVFIMLSLVGTSAFCQVRSIAEIKEIGADLRPVTFGEIVTVQGVVTAASGTFSQQFADLDAYIQDKTGGINIYTRNLPGLTLDLGDSVVVTGRINVSSSNPIAGTTRLRIESADGLLIVGTGTLPEPEYLPADTLTKATVPPAEPHEGLLARLEGVTIDDGMWPSEPGMSAELTASDPIGSFTLYVNEHTDIGGSEPPSEPFILIGLVVQNSRNFSGNYTIWPRSRFGDFLVTGNGSGIATVEPSEVENDVEAFDLHVTLAGNGLDTITTFSIDLPLGDGWGWAGGMANVELSGPGLSAAAYEATASGALVSGSVIVDGKASFGTVKLKGMSPPSGIIVSEVVVKTSVDGVSLEEIGTHPKIEAVYPKPDLVINEVYPHDGTTTASNAFLEIYNRGDFTAFLQGYVLAEPQAVSYCNIAVRHVFDADTLEAGAYLVVAESATGFTQRFGFTPDVVAGIRPLGRKGGDGAVCGTGQKYEAVSLWTDTGLTDMIDYVEYRDALACTADVCGGFGGDKDAFPYIPPVGYALVEGAYDPCCPYQVLTGSPTPGAENEQAYLVPTVAGNPVSHETNIVEVTFSEPMDAATLEHTANYLIDDDSPLAAVASLSREKVLLLFENLTPGLETLRISGLRSMPGKTMSEGSYGFAVSSTKCPPIGTVQAYDSDGFSPLTGSTVCILGFITVPPGIFQPDYSAIYVQGLDGSGVNVFSYDVPSPAPKMGDFVYITGEVEEYVSSGGAGATTELYMSSAGGLVILSGDYPEPAPLVLTTAGIGREDHEGKLVETEGAIISTSAYDFYIDDGSGGIQVYQNYTPIDFTQFEEGMYVRVKGVVLQYDYARPYLEGYELVPRYETDIEIIEDAFPAEALLKVQARVFCPSCGEENFDITFGGPGSSDVVLRLFDGGGRNVRTLYSGRSVGPAVVGWDGRDSDGKVVSPGLYVCHLEVVEAVTGRRSMETVPIVVGMKLK